MAKTKTDNEYLDRLRHSCAHLLAAAVLDLFPKAKLAIGPAIEDGFYYDVDFGPSTGSGQAGNVAEDNLPKIEEKMHELVRGWDKFERIELEKNRSLEKNDSLLKAVEDNPYKQELLGEIKQVGGAICFYRSGNFVDLCSGPHIEGKPAEELKYFKLLKIAGAYWRGSEKNKMLTRIYGTVWPTKEGLDKYLEQLRLAEERDHRKLGRELDLFTFSDLVGPGLPLFTPKGALIRRELEDFVQSLQEPLGYQRVVIPHLGKVELYKKSGHWEKYKENMFPVTSDEGVKFAMKPMNCPHHIELFASRQRSYREMPQRYSEVTAVYRQEKGGELLGLTRVYMLTQDDAHNFCTEEQAVEEALGVYSIIKNFYAAFGFGVEMKVRLSLRDPEKPEKYLGDDAIWEKSEKMMREVAKRAGLEVYEGIGEAAFYAPKLDFMAYDSLGRQWQLATIQLDLNFPERFDLKYIDKDGKEKRPVIIHRAILGSVERFMSILIEHYAGAFPTWLSPVQVVVLPIADRHLEYAKMCNEQWAMGNIRSEVDDRQETLSAKIRDAQMQKVPYMIIIGDKEQGTRDSSRQMISVRSRDRGDLGKMELQKFISEIKIEISEKRIVKAV